MIYCFDIDGTICSNTDGDYMNAVPFHDRIAKINKLYEDGNKITTLRGDNIKEQFIAIIDSYISRNYKKIN